jgi:hypothetical protein
VRFALFAIAYLLATATGTLGAGTRVYIVLIDGLDASFVGASLTPNLWQLATGPGTRRTFYPHASAVMPSVTTTNHVAIITGTYAQANGIVANVLWDRGARAPAGSEDARNLEVETLFTVIKKERPSLTTAALFGKARLVGFFTEAGGLQRRPDVLWGDARTEDEPVDPRAGFASDERTMDETLRVLTERSPDLLFVALPDVDRTAHVFGPESNEARRAVLEADRQVGRLVSFARRQGTWDHLVLMVTADHGMESVTPDAARPNPILLFGRELVRAGFTDVHPVSSGGVELVALDGEAPTVLSGAAAERLRAVRALALEQPEVSEAWYRLPNPVDGGDAFTLERAHPDWRLVHPRVGELVLVAAPHCFFGDPFSPRRVGLAGDHGGPAQRAISILLTGGDRRLRASPLPPAEISVAMGATNPDLGATAAWLLGVRQPRYTNGRPVGEGLRGRVLREAFE